VLKTKFLSFFENEITSVELGVDYIDIEIFNDENILMSPKIWDALKRDDVEQSIECQTWTRYGDFCVTFNDDSWSFDGENVVPLNKPVKTCLDNNINTGRGVFNSFDLKMAKKDRGISISPWAMSEIGAPLWCSIEGPRLFRIH
jgi:hypothetical protein